MSPQANMLHLRRLAASLTVAADLAWVLMDEITADTKKLTLKLSDAAGGTGTAVDALRRLHQTATDLRALPLDERIVAIQDSLPKFVPLAERAAVASAFFRDMSALALSRIDSATLRLQEVTGFGGAISEHEAVQIRTADDAIDRLGPASSGPAPSGPAPSGPAPSGPA